MSAGRDRDLLAAPLEQVDRPEERRGDRVPAWPEADQITDRAVPAGEQRGPAHAVDVEPDLTPTSELALAGDRIEPEVSLPNVIGARPTEAATPEPALEPLGVWVTS